MKAGWPFHSHRQAQELQNYFNKIKLINRCGKDGYLTLLGFDKIAKFDKIARYGKIARFDKIARIDKN